MKFAKAKGKKMLLSSFVWEKKGYEQFKRKTFQHSDSNLNVLQFQKRKFLPFHRHRTVLFFTSAQPDSHHAEFVTVFT